MSRPRRNERKSGSRAAKASLPKDHTAQILHLDKDQPHFEQRRVIIEPKTLNQEFALKNLRRCEISAAVGPAGVGKTYVTAGVAAEMYLAESVDKIILTRANVTIGETIGALPGTINEKMEPLLKPILSAIERHLTPGRVKYMLNKQQIEMLPFEFVRGRNFKDEFVIIDEAQNLTEDDMIAIVTRFESGRIVLLGDPIQNDLKSESGLVWLSKFCERNGLNIPIVNYQLKDIVRSSFVKKFLTALYKERGLYVEPESESTEIQLDLLKAD